jgi:hypothetical protein
MHVVQEQRGEELLNEVRFARPGTRPPTSSMRRYGQCVAVDDAMKRGELQAEPEQFDDNPERGN